MNFRYAQGLGVCAPQPIGTIFERPVMRIREPQARYSNFEPLAEGCLAAA
jgi:hypothetical protein